MLNKNHLFQRKHNLYFINLPQTKNWSVLEKRIKIINAALKLFVSHGAHAVTIAQIAAEAQVGIGTLYKHFSSKEDIIQQIWIWQKEEESTFIFKNFTAKGTIHDQFNFLWERVIRYFVSHPLEYQFSYQFAASPVLTKEIHNVAMKDFLIFDDLFQKGLEEKMFKPLTARQLRLFTFSTINGWILWAIDEKMEFSDDTISLFLDMAWDSIKN
jgi:AcrR family transcriptional regulator